MREKVRRVKLHVGGSPRLYEVTSHLVWGGLKTPGKRVPQTPSEMKNNAAVTAFVGASERNASSRRLITCGAASKYLNICIHFNWAKLSEKRARINHTLDNN